MLEGPKLEVGEIHFFFPLLRLCNSLVFAQIPDAHVEMFLDFGVKCYFDGVHGASGVGAASPLILLLYAAVSP